MLPDFSITSVLDGNLIRATIELTEPSLTNDKFAFYLIRDGEPIWRGQYGVSDTALFRIVDSGTYQVKAFLARDSEKTSRRSNPIEFTNFSRGETHRPLPDLEYTPLDYPHQDFAILQFSQNDPNESRDHRLAALAATTNLHYTTWATANSNLHILSLEPLSGSADSPSIFSGMTRTSERFIFGSDDLDETTTDFVGDQVGDSILATFDARGVRISTDYFGVGKVYYHDGDHNKCISNRYHLLLLALRAIEAPLRIDSEKARANLAALSQPFMQNFSRNMDVESCFMLPVGSNLELKDGRLNITESSLSKELGRRNDSKIEADEYRTLIEESATEIIDNLRIVLEHPRFSYARVDVTSGMDARMVYAALTHLTSFRDKIHIHTADVPLSPMDLTVSLALTGEFHFDYDTIPREMIEYSLEDSFLENSSINLGSYFGIKPERSRTKLNDTIRINGFYGEITARPYYSRSYLARDTGDTEAHHFADTLVESVPQDRRVLTEANDLKRTLAHELSNLPGGSALEQFENHYLFYRNGLHCSDRWLNHVLAPGWGPLQSKTMFHLKTRTFNEFKDIRVQLDVTDYLNWNVSRFPYGREKDNDDRRRLGYKLLQSGMDVRDLPQVDRTGYDAAKIERGRQTRRRVRPDAQVVASLNESFTSTIRHWTQKLLEDIHTNSSLLSESALEDVRNYSEARANDSESAPTLLEFALLNKLFSLRSQMQLISGPRD